jgi:hypothetical protein
MKAATLIAALVLLAPAAYAQESYKKDLPDSLVKHAKVTESEAAATAQKRVPKGKIKSVEIERENKKLIYSYDFETPGKSGIDEVNVDAMTGKVIGGVQHETPATEKKEAAEEAKAMKKGAKKP